MSSHDKTALWRVFGASVLGEAHLRGGVHNQDAIGWLPRAGVSGRVVLAVADGHGGPAYSRSAEGAAIAVRTANSILYDLLASPERVRGLQNSEQARAVLAGALVAAWRDEVDIAAQLDKNASVERFRPFGTTLVAAGVSPDWLIYVQLGDGDLVALDEAGVASRPFSADPRLVGNATTSFCLPDADSHVRIKVVARHLAPALIGLATDGYVNSFEDEDGFLRAWHEMANQLRMGGVDQLAYALEGWLAETTKLGSGDDITVGVLVPLDATMPATALDQQDAKSYSQPAVDRDAHKRSLAEARDTRITELERVSRSLRIAVYVLTVLAVLLAGAATGLALLRGKRHEVHSVSGCLVVRSSMGGIGRHGAAGLPPIAKPPPPQQGLPKSQPQTAPQPAPGAVEPSPQPHPPPTDQSTGDQSPSIHATPQNKGAEQ